MLSLNDKVYGRISISDPLAEAIIRSKSMRRLSGINQYGAVVLSDPHKNTTRLEHSIGVYHILVLFGAPREECLAGLLHDISHTVFSHVIDKIFDSDEKSYHDKIFEATLESSEIPGILSRHGLSLKEVIRGENPLLTAELPDLSADRIDYFLRDGVTVGKLSRVQAERILASVKMLDFGGRWMFAFSGMRNALLASKKYLQLSYSEWASPIQNTFSKFLAEAIAEGLRIGIITGEDLTKLTEKEFMAKLVRNSNFKIREKLSLISKRTRIKFNDKKWDYVISRKARFLDPLVLEKDSRAPSRLSEIFPDYLREISKYKKWLERTNKIEVFREGH